MSSNDIPFDSAQLLIGGAWRSAASGVTLMLENPSDASILAPIARGAAADVNAAVGAARAALDGGEWGRLAAAERGRVPGNGGVRGILRRLPPSAGGSTAAECRGGPRRG